jgi:hypothetical protein
MLLNVYHLQISFFKVFKITSKLKLLVQFHHHINDCFCSEFESGVPSFGKQHYDRRGHCQARRALVLDPQPEVEQLALRVSQQVNKSISSFRCF